MTTNSSPNKLRKSDRESFTAKEVLKTFMKNKDVPGWFRGLSVFQFEAVGNIFVALRDDVEQGTSNRVQTCLDCLGINPLLPDKDLKILIHLCRNNDIAFLWFLMELEYKTEGNEYSLNEQLIMSAIAHLDTVTTIIELDRILPQPLTPLKSTSLQKKPVSTNKRRKCIFPYFEKQKRPVHSGKSLVLKRPDFKVSIPRVFTLENSPLRINETNRWFANYTLQPGKRVIKHLLEEQINRISDSTIFNMGIKSKYKAIDISVSSEPSELLLCDFHKQQKEMEQLFKNELFLIAKERCLKLLDGAGKHREQCQKRVLEKLNQDIDMFMCLYKKMIRTHKYQPVKFITCAQCIIADVPDPDTELDCCDVRKCTTEETENNITTQQAEENISDSNNQISRNSSARHPMLNACLAYPGDHINNNNRNDSNNNNNYDSNDNFEKDNNINNNNNNNEKKKENHNMESSSEPNVVNSQKFFKRPTENNPFKFDYTKIFHFESDEINIKKTFVHAMDNTAEIVENTTNLPVEVNEAASNMIKKLWIDNVAIHCKEMDIAEQIEIREKSIRGTIFPQAYYNPHDQQLMQKMLEEALKEMKKDRKFVLASLPNSHKLPLLLEWIRSRYGKLYSDKNRQEEYSLTMKIYYALTKGKEANPVIQSGIGDNVKIDYSCREYVLRKGQEIKKKFTNLLDESIMEQTRVFWFAMRPYLWSGGPPRNTYFAYMPSRKADLTKFRLWRSSEFMDAKSEWDKKMTNLKRLQNISGGTCKP